MYNFALIASKSINNASKQKHYMLLHSVNGYEPNSTHLQRYLYVNSIECRLCERKKKNSHVHDEKTSLFVTISGFFFVHIRNSFFNYFAANWNIKKTYIFVVQRWFCWWKNVQRYFLALKIMLLNCLYLVKLNSRSNYGLAFDEAMAISVYLPKFSSIFKKPPIFWLPLSFG